MYLMPSCSTAARSQSKIDYGSLTKNRRDLYGRSEILPNSYTVCTNACQFTTIVGFQKPRRQLEQPPRDKGLESRFSGLIFI